MTTLTDSTQFHVTVAVVFTDRTRQADGTYTLFTRTPTVMVSGGDDPTLVAAQMVAALIQDFDGMVLGTDVVDAFC